MKSNRKFFCGISIDLLLSVQIFDWIFDVEFFKSEIFESLLSMIESMRYRNKICLQEISCNNKFIDKNKIPSHNVCQIYLLNVQKL